MTCGPAARMAEPPAPSAGRVTGTAAGQGGRRNMGRPEVGQGRLGWIFVAPIVVLIVVLVGYPLILVRDEHAERGDLPRRDDPWVGLGNYADLATGGDTMSAAVHTAGYWIIAVTVEIGIGLAAALALRHPFRGRSLPWRCSCSPGHCRRSSRVCCGGASSTRRAAG